MRLVRGMAALLAAVATLFVLIGPSSAIATIRVGIGLRSTAQGRQPVAAENDAAFEFTASYCFGHRPNKKRIVHRFVGVSAKIRDAVP